MSAGVKLDRLEDGRYALSIDGQDISDHVYRVSIEVEARNFPQVIVELAANTKWTEVFHGDADVTINEAIDEVTTMNGDVIRP